jgi:hypothetical protein
VINQMFVPVKHEEQLATSEHPWKHVQAYADSGGVTQKPLMFACKTTVMWMKSDADKTRANDPVTMYRFAHSLLHYAVALQNHVHVCTQL